jgi:hypothetical protein
MIYPEIVDFQKSDIYSGETLTGHVPDISETGNAWNIIDGTITTRNGASEIGAGDWGEPGAYFETTSAMASMNLETYKARTFSFRIWFQSLGSPTFFLIIRTNEYFSEGFFIGFTYWEGKNQFMILCTDTILYPGGVVANIDFDILPEYAKPIPYPSSSSPTAYYADVDIIDNGTEIQTYINGISILNSGIAKSYLNNNFIGISGGIGSGNIVSMNSMEIQETSENVFIESSVNRLLYQYRESTNLKNIIRGLAKQSYDENKNINRIFTREILSMATGEQLDIWGNIIGISRGTMTNTEYRVAIYLKIFINYSEGRIEDLIYVFDAFMNPTNVELTELAPATISLQANDPVTPDLESARLAIEVCKASGVEINSLSFSEGPAFAFLEYSSTEITTSGFDDGTGAIGGILSTGI